MVQLNLYLQSGNITDAPATHAKAPRKKDTDLPSGYTNALMLGSILADDEAQEVIYDVTDAGATELTFQAKLSSEDGFDTLDVEFRPSGTYQSYSGQVDWAEYTLAVPSGTTQVVFWYAKDGSAASYDDAVYLTGITGPITEDFSSDTFFEQYVPPPPPEDILFRAGTIDVPGEVVGNSGLQSGFTGVPIPLSGGLFVGGYKQNSILAAGYTKPEYKLRVYEADGTTVAEKLEFTLPPMTATQSANDKIIGGHSIGNNRVLLLGMPQDSVPQGTTLVASTFTTVYIIGVEYDPDTNTVSHSDWVFIRQAATNNHLPIVYPGMVKRGAILTFPIAEARNSSQSNNPAGFGIYPVRASWDGTGNPAVSVQGRMPIATVTPGSSQDYYTTVLKAIQISNTQALWHVRFLGASPTTYALLLIHAASGMAETVLIADELEDPLGSGYEIQGSLSTGVFYGGSFSSNQNGQGGYELKFRYVDISSGSITLSGETAMASNLDTSGSYLGSDLDYSITIDDAIYPVLTLYPSDSYDYTEDYPVRMYESGGAVSADPPGSMISDPWYPGDPDQDYSGLPEEIAGAEISIGGSTHFVVTRDRPDTHLNGYDVYSTAPGEPVVDPDLTFIPGDTKYLKYIWRYRPVS